MCTCVWLTLPLLDLVVRERALKAPMGQLGVPFAWTDGTHAEQVVYWPSDVV